MTRRLLAFSLIALAPTSLLAQHYKITDLSVGSPLPMDSLAYGISGNGKVTGTGTDPNTGELHAFVYQAGVFQDLGDYGYLYGADGIRINDNGQVAGTGYGPGYHAVLYSNGKVKALGSIDGGSTSAWGMNNSGDIVGRGINGDGGGQGFSYIGGKFSALNVDIARGINDNDQYVGSMGYTWVYGGYLHEVEHAFVDNNGVNTELGDIGGGLRTNTEAFSINNSGKVTGYSTAADGTLHAFLFSNGVMSDLGGYQQFDTFGLSINNAGQVAGNIETPYGGQIDGFLYSNGKMNTLTDLLGPGGAAWSQLTINQMNDSGWIVGYGTIDGATHGFLAKPVPEPASLLACGVATLGLLRRRINKTRPQCP